MALSSFPLTIITEILGLMYLVIYVEYIKNAGHHLLAGSHNGGGRYVGVGKIGR